MRKKAENRTDDLTSCGELRSLAESKYNSPEIVDLGDAERLTQGGPPDKYSDGNSPSNPNHFKH